MTTEPTPLEPIWSDNDIANDAKRADSSPTVQAKKSIWVISTTKSMLQGLVTPRRYDILEVTQF